MSRRLTDEEIAARYSNQYRVETPEAGLSELGGSAIDRFQAKAYGLVEPLGLSRDYRLAQEAEAERTSQRYYDTNPNAVGSYKNISGVGDVGRYAAELGVQSLPEIVPVVGAGLVGGPAAAFGVAGISGIGEVMQAQRQQAGRTDATAVPLGLAYGGVEAATGIVGKLAGTGLRAERAAAFANKYLDNLSGFSGGLARTGSSFARTGLSEAAGEVAQEYISNVGRLAIDPRVELFSPEAMDDYAESFVGGGLLGGLLGAGAGGWRRSQGYREAARERDLTSSQQEQTPLIPRPADSQFVTQDQTVGLQSFINQNVGVNRPKRKDYVAQFKAAYDEPTGQFVSDPETGIERPLTVGEALQRSQAALDLTQEKPAETAATAQVVANTVRDPRSYELRDTFGVIPTPSSLQLYSDIQATGIPVDSDLLVDVWKFAGEKPMTPKRLEKAQQLLDAAIIKSRQEAPSGTGIPSVSQPAGGLGGGSAVVPGVVGTAGPSVAPTGGDVQPAGAAGAPVQQAGTVPVVTSQPSAPVTTGEPSGTEASQTIQAAPQGQAAAPIQPAAAAVTEPDIISQIFGEQDADIVRGFMMGKSSTELAAEAKAKGIKGRSEQMIRNKIAGEMAVRDYWPAKIEAAKKKFGYTDEQIKQALEAAIAPDTDTRSEVEREMNLGRADLYGVRMSESEAIEAGLEGSVKSAGAGSSAVKGFTKLQKEIDAMYNRLEVEKDPMVLAWVGSRLSELQLKVEAFEDREQARIRATAGLGDADGEVDLVAASQEAESKTTNDADAAKEAEAAKFRAERAAKLKADRKGLAVGDTVMNPKLGTGVVKSFAGDGDATTVTVEFQSGQTKELSVKLAKLEKTNAVQVESPAGVSVQPEAEAGQGVGKQVRRAKKPATEGKVAAPAVPAKILTEAEQAAQAWDVVVADYPQAPKFAELTKAQQQNFIEFGPGNWERGDVELELTKLARTAATTQRTLTNEPVTIDVEARVVEETVGPQVAALPVPQVTRLENHYGVKRDTPEFLAKVKADVVLYATKGAEAVAGAIRDVIKAIHAGVLSVAMIFNPTAVSQIESFVVIPQETRTTTTQVLAELPAEVQGMSEAGKQAYATLIPALKGKIGDKFVTIADKPSGRVFVFKANGELVLQKKALFGLAKGDLYKGNNDLKQNRVTPAGLFGIHVVDAAKGGAAATTAGEYDFGKVFALDDPDATVTFMHSVWLKESDAAKRAAALKNDSAADSRYSFGCINVDKETFKDMVGKYSSQMDGSKLFVVPDVQSTVNDFITGNVANDRLVREGVQPVTKTTTTPVQSATKTGGVDRTVAAKEEEQTTTTATRAQESFMRMSRQSTRLFSTDLYLGKENVSGQPQYGRELRNPVTLNDGTRLDGFTSQDQSVFSGYDRNGQRISVPQESVKPSDIKASRDSNRTANALKAALGTTRKSRRSVRTADQSGTEFESVEASLEDLSKYSEGIAAGIRGLQNSGMGNAVDAIDSWMVTFSPVSWDAIYTMIDGKRTIIYNGVILKDKVLATTATLHEVGHGIDEVQTGAGKFSNDKEFKLSRVNGELMSMRPGTAMDELLNHFEDSSETSPIGALLNYPLDMSDANNRSLTIQELREEVFAQVWAFSNMNGGMDYLRDNLPTTHAFMEKVHEQVKATNYAAAQGAQQGTQSGQVQAGQQGTQPTGAIFRASRQRQGLIDRNIAKLPKDLRQPVRNSVGVLGDIGGKGLDYVVFTSDLVKRAVAAGMPSAQKFSDVLARRAARVSELERQIEKIADGYADIEDEFKGSGRGSVNDFLFESTRTGKWGYGKFRDAKMGAEFDKLGPKAQKFVKDVFAHGDKMLSDKKKIVLEAATSEYDAMIKAAQDANDTKSEASLKAEKAATLKRFQTLFRIREGIPYAPIKRNGTQVVIGKSAEYLAAVAAKNTARIKQLESDPDHYHVSFADSKWEARTLKDKLAEQGVFTELDIVTRSQAFEEAFSGESLLPALTKMRAAVDKQTADGKKDPTAGKMLNIINQLYLEALAEGSARKSEMRRRGVAGEVDMLQSFTQQGRADANFLANVQFEPQVQDQLQNMRNESRRGDRERKSEIFNELTQRYADSLDVKVNSWVNGLTGLASKFFLATSPAYYLQNLTQPFMMSLPAMAGRHDYGKAAVALGEAYTELGPLFKDVKLFDQQFDFSKVPADVRTAINELVNQGKIDIGLATEINEYKVEADGKLSAFAQRLNKGMRMAVQKTEAVNRLSTAIAAYRLEYAKTKDAAKATQYAADILSDTHGDYTAFNAPRAFNTQWGKVALQFRKFQLIQIAFYAKLIRDAFTKPDERAAAMKTLAYSLAHTGVFAGLMGMPGYAAIAFVLGLFGDEDEPYDLTADMRKALGPEWADLIMRGAPTLAGVDLSGKIGSGNMLSIMPFSDADLTTNAGRAEALGTFFGGAAFGMTSRVIDGLLYMLDGDYYKGIERVMPKGVSDALKAGRQATEGMTRRNGDVMLPENEIGLISSVLTGLGVPSVQQSVTYERQNRMRDLTENFQDRTTRIKNDYAKAARQKDTAAMQQAREAWTKLQQARQRNGLKPQPVSNLLKAPQEQAQREKRTVGGVQYREGQRKLAEQVTAD